MLNKLRGAIHALAVRLLCKAAGIDRLIPVEVNNQTVLHVTFNSRYDSMSREIAENLMNNFGRLKDEHQPLMIIYSTRDISIESLDLEQMRARGWIRNESFSALRAA